ncbi:hypothetical protein J4Q44_G00292040, partial [Coregonus suidteri]
MSEPGSGCGVPAQRSSQRGPEMLSVKLKDCSQTLELNVIVKEEEREIKEEEEESEDGYSDSVDSGESSNPGSDSKPCSTASGKRRQKPHPCCSDSCIYPSRHK